MTFEEEEDILATISTESAKLKNLKETYDIEATQMKNTKKTPGDTVVDATDVAEKLREERKEKIEHDRMLKRDAEEKRHLLQAVIREAEESGFPMPPSLIKLLNHTNGKLLYI